MRCLLDAVSHMHGYGISHRDLKLENLVLARPQQLRSVTIVDFGLAKAARARERMEGVTGTLWYTAPEILLGEPYSPLVDLWSLGVVMYLLLTGAPSPRGAAASASSSHTFQCMVQPIQPPLSKLRRGASPLLWHASCVWQGCRTCWGRYG